MSLLLRIFLALVFTLLTFSAIAKNSSGSMQSLQKLSSQINYLENLLKKSQHQKDDLQENLKTTEIKTSQIDLSLEQLHLKIEDQDQAIQKLKGQQKIHQARLQQQKIKLTVQIRQSYLIGHDDYLKVLLNNEDPQTISRMLHYFSYLHRERSQIINEIQQTLIQLKDTEKEKLQKIIGLQKLFQEKQKRQFSLLQTQKKRKEIIHQIGNKISTRQAKLVHLNTNKQQLEKVIQQLKQNANQTAVKNLNFVKLQHHLPWPTYGKISHHFNPKKADIDINANGIFIEGTEGQAIEAVAPGKIIFADWMRGFGLVIILDHGSGYMSLYAHNHSLYHQEGEFVNKGELLASLGQSGGASNSGLYFELRHNGKAINPETWIKNKV